MEEKTFYIRMLSPVHIGCDEVYEPTGFIINEDSGTLTAFEPLDFFRSLSARDKSDYSAKCAKGDIASILEIYKFMRGKRFEGHVVDVCKGLIAQYHKTIDISLNDRKRIQQELNNFSINRTAYNPITQKPYIPGSAVKGALRTAYLNQMAKTKNVTVDHRDRNPANTLEKELLAYQKLEQDPFRLLKVSDFHPVGPCPTKIIYAVNAKKKPSKYDARGPFQILEVIQQGTVFAGGIQVLKPLARDVIKTPLSAEKVLESATAFYNKEKRREDAELDAAGLPPGRITTDKGICPLRIGRHSGAESLTIEGHRRIKIMKKKGERPDFADKATTFWLASETSESKTAENLQPFGWVTLGAMTESLQEELEDLAAKKQIALAAIAESHAAKVQVEEKKSAPPPPIEEAWEDATVTYEAGGAGKIIAQMQGKTQAMLQGSGNRENLKNAVAGALNKNIFEKKRPVKARVTVRKVGNSWEIIKVEPLDGA